MSDLLSDLRADLAAAPAAPVRPTTPALELRLTPLRWAWPQVEGGALRLGPLRVALTRA